MSNGLADLLGSPVKLMVKRHTSDGQHNSHGDKYLGIQKNSDFPSSCLYDYTKIKKLFLNKAYCSNIIVNLKRKVF